MTVATQVRNPDLPRHAEITPKAKVAPSRLRLVDNPTAAPVDVEQVLSETTSSERALRTAFQPVCDLKSREIIGYEASLGSRGGP